MNQLYILTVYFENDKEKILKADIIINLKNILYPDRIQPLNFETPIKYKGYLNS